MAALLRLLRTQPETPIPLLAIENLRTYFFDRDPPTKAVDGAALSIERGEMFGLVGESGSGKTMLALSIGRLLPRAGRIVEGSIRFEGQELTGLPDQDLRRLRGGRIGYVFQDPMSSLNPVLSIGDQLCEALELHRSLRGEPARRLALELLEQVQVPLPAERLRQYPHQLSGGMRQRVMLAMALAGEPDLLIADEPTTALDVKTQADILGLIKRLRQLRGMAVLLITHDLGAVAPHADRIGVMQAGRIVETAPAGQLYRSPSHPYTRALLACIFRPGQGKRGFE